MRQSSPGLTGLGVSGAEPARRRYGTLLQSNPVAFLELQLCLRQSRRSPSHSQMHRSRATRVRARADSVGTAQACRIASFSSSGRTSASSNHAQAGNSDPKSHANSRRQTQGVSLGPQHSATAPGFTRATRPSLQLGSPPLPYTVSAAIYGHNWGRVILIRLPFYKPLNNNRSAREKDRVQPAGRASRAHTVLMSRPTRATVPHATIRPLGRAAKAVLHRQTIDRPRW